MRQAVRLFAVCAASLVVSTAGSAEQTLFERLGGQPAIERTSDLLIDDALRDPRIASDFSQSNIPRLKSRIALYLCAVTDGPCTYHGRSMAASHRGLHLNEAHFNALVEDLEDAMDTVGIPYHTQNALLARLAPLERGIVTR